MKRRTLTIALAALLAVLGMVAVLAYVHQANTRAVAGLKSETVVAARSYIASGTSLREAKSEGSLESERVPIASVPRNAVLAVTASNSKRVLNAAVQPGELLLQPMLETAAQVTGGIAIPPSMIAVSVEVCLPQAVAGYVTDGSDVAVFDTYPASGSKGASSLDVQASCQGSHQAERAGSIETQIVLPRVQVISVATGSAGTTSACGSAFTAGATSSTASSGTVLVTFAVSQADAERLISLSEAGLPYLALLTPSSKTSFDTQPAPLFQAP